VRTAVLVVLALALPALAQANPIPLNDIYISFDPAGSRMHEITPEPGTTVSAYVVVDQSELGTNGFTTVAFKLSHPVEDFPGSFSSAEFTNLLPGAIGIGEWHEGIVMAATECMQWPVVVGQLDCFYLGGPASICIEDHPEHWHMVTDCNDPAQTVPYDTPANGMIAGGDGDCDPGAPVENVTWGVIKALYR